MNVANERALVSLRRAKPLLGTIVDICVEADNAELAQCAVSAAFAEIAEVHTRTAGLEVGSRQRHVLTGVGRRQ